MEQKHIWDYFQGDAVSSFDGNLPRMVYLLKLISAEETRILNVGVGNGAFEKLAINEGKDIFSLDPSDVAIDRLVSELNMEGRAKVGLSQKIPFPDDYFDVVVISEVLEHLDDRVLDKTLREIKRVLKLNGRMIGSVPARENLNEQIVICPKCGDQFHRWGHVQSFNKIRIRRLLERDFEIVKVSEKYFVFWSQLNFKGKCVALAKMMFFMMGIHGSSETLVFIAELRG